MPATNYEPQCETLNARRSHVGELFSAMAQSCLKQAALVQGDRNFTFEQVDKRTNQLAHALKTQGLTIGDRIAVLARNCLEYLEIELAAAKCGIIVAALNWRLADKELAHCIELVAPDLILVDLEHANRVSNLGIGEFPQWCIGQEYEKLLAQNPTRYVQEQFDGEAGLVILYTSGTTGMPKGALISHRAMIARSALFASDLRLKPGANFIAWAPLFHMASTDQGLATLLMGGTVYIVDGYRPEELMHLAQTIPVGWFVLMPGMVGDFAEKCRANGVKPLDITVCGAMADLVPRAEIAAVTRALNAPYANTFGATETGLAPATRNTIPIGEAPLTLPKRQSSLTQVRLVDAQDNDVEFGEPGEVALRGATLFSGYWNADQTNAQDFRNGWFHMGDVMRRNENGTLDYVDRVKYLIKSGGENIYPAEIEQVIVLDERIEQAVVVRCFDDKWGEVPVVFIVSSDPHLTKDDIFEICSSLSRYKLPKQVYFVADDDLPRSTTGKIQRHELEKRIQPQE